MVIGRAVNGWSVKGQPTDCKGEGWYAKDLKYKSEVESLIRGVRCLSESLSYEGWENSAEKVNIRPKLKIEDKRSNCPMSWVVEKAGSKNGGYNTNQSAFWRVNKKILKALYPKKDLKEQWSSHLCWSNLYKVAPLKTGNPLKSWRDIQEQYCKKLLEIELESYKPKCVLVMAGNDWYEPLVCDLGIEVEDFPGDNRNEKDKLVEKSGLRDGQAWVFAKHPQARRENCFASEVKKAFDCITQSSE